jgi:heme exporter protein C
VDWWNTLHQPASVVKMGGPSIHLSMLIPLVIMAVGFTTFYVAVLILRMRGAIVGAKLRALQMAMIERGS